jgi:DNA-binding response OmpR family regulator
MHPPTFLLVVDPDPLFQEMVESGLRLHDPSLAVLKADDPTSALALMQRCEVDAVLTELDFPERDGDGVDFLLGLKKSAPRMPVVVVTERRPEVLRQGLPADAVVSKPPDMDFLLRKVDQALHERRESVLRGISLESFLQVLAVERKTCTLTVNAGRELGRLYLQDGELIHAETENSLSKEAAFAMLSWPDYTIRITERCDATPTISDRLNAILLEWCVQKDHGLL